MHKYVLRVHARVLLCARVHRAQMREISGRASRLVISLTQRCLLVLPASSSAPTTLPPRPACLLLRPTCWRLCRSNLKLDGQYMLGPTCRDIPLRPVTFGTHTHTHIASCFRCIRPTVMIPWRSSIRRRAPRRNELIPINNIYMN